MTLLCLSSSIFRKEIDSSLRFQGQDSVHTLWGNSSFFGRTFNKSDLWNFWKI